MRKPAFVLVLLFIACFYVPFVQAQTKPKLVIFDTDIGDDIDDAYALALLLQSPEVKVLGVTTAFGDTQLRARLVSRLMMESGHEDIPVFAGPATAPKTVFTQAAWAQQAPDRKYSDAIEFMARTIREHPGEITLISVAPFTNVGALIKKDPKTFRTLKRVVIMGGSVERGYGDPERKHPDAEWNIQCDISAAQALFASGVPLYVMPLDSTQIPLDAARQKTIFDHGATLTTALRELTQQWRAHTQPHQETPTLFDAMAAAYALQPQLCPTTPMRIEVDDRGFTQRVSGAANANVCLTSDANQFFAFYLPRVAR